MRVALIACSSKKLDRPAPAKDLYLGPLFRLSYKYARQIPADKIFILSAKYGLVHPDDVIAPYDVTLKDMRDRERAEWSARVVFQLADRELPADDHSGFIVLAGMDYRARLVEILPRCFVPLAGLGIGQQLQRLNELTRGK